MSRFLKLEFVKENFDLTKVKGTSEMRPISDSFEHFEVYFNADLITVFVECEGIQGNGTSINDDDFEDCFENGTMLYLSDEGIKVIDEICERFYAIDIAHDAAYAKGSNIALVTNSVENIIKQLNGNIEE